MKKFTLARRRTLVLSFGFVVPALPHAQLTKGAVVKQIDLKC